MSYSLHVSSFLYGEWEDKTIAMFMSTLSKQSLKANKHLWPHQLLILQVTFLPTSWARHCQFEPISQHFDNEFCSHLTSKLKNAVKSTKKAVNVHIVISFCCFSHIHSLKRHHHASFFKIRMSVTTINYIRQMTATAHTQYTALLINTLCFIMSQLFWLEYPVTRGRMFT